MAIICNKSDSLPTNFGCNRSANWSTEMTVLNGGVYLDGEYIGKLIGFQGDLAVVERISDNKYLNGKQVLIGCGLDQMNDLKNQYPDLPKDLKIN